MREALVNPPLVPLLAQEELVDAEHGHPNGEDDAEKEPCEEVEHGGEGSGGTGGGVDEGEGERK